MTEMCMELHTQRLRLQPLSAGDGDDMYALSRLPEVMRYTSMPTQTRAGSDAFLERWLAGMRGGSIASWTIRDMDSEFLGWASVFNLDLKNHSGEIGYMLVPGGWGKGYGSEVVTALIRYGFNHCNLVRLNADVDPGNLASIRLLEKHGFAKEGFRRATLYKENAFYDSLLFGLLNEKRLAELSPA